MGCATSGGLERLRLHAVMCLAEASGLFVGNVVRLLEALGGCETQCFEAGIMSGLKQGCASYWAGDGEFRGMLMSDSAMMMMMQLDIGEYVRLGRHHVARVLYERWYKRKNNE